MKEGKRMSSFAEKRENETYKKFHHGGVDKLGYGTFEKHLQQPGSKRERETKVIGRADIATDSRQIW